MTLEKWRSPGKCEGEIQSLPLSQNVSVSNNQGDTNFLKFWFKCEPCLNVFQALVKKKFGEAVRYRRKSAKKSAATKNTLTWGPDRAKRSDKPETTYKGKEPVSLLYFWQQGKGKEYC